MWAGVRVALAWNGVFNPGVSAELALLAVVGLAVWVDALRRSEDLFLGNLGIPSWAIAVLALPVALLAELLVP